MDIEIPYNVEERKDTGLYNSKLGIWLFLASEIMLFGALFSSYIILRSGDPLPFLTGQAKLNVPLATLNTAVLILSSVTFVMSWVSLKLQNFTRYRMYMGITLICSILFLVIKYFEYETKLSNGYTPSYSNFYAVYFTVTGLHAIHIIGGIFVNYYLWKVFDSRSQMQTSKIFNLIALFCLLLPWGNGIYGYETNIGAILLLCCFSSLLITQFEELSQFKYILPIFITIISFYSLFTFTGIGYYLFLIFNSLNVIDIFLIKPNVTYEAQPENFTNRVEVAGLYWHFVDLVWIFVFPSIYLL